MLFNVAQLLQEDPGATRRYEIDEPPYQVDEGVESVSPLRGTVKLNRTNRGVLADADVATDLKLECSRCLEEVVVPIKTHITEEYYPTVDLRSGVAVDRPDGGTGFMLNEAHELDLTEPVRQSILLELPMKPLCRADCAGLCPRCGQNLNERRCDCAIEPADPRLSQLGEWLKGQRVHSSEQR
jgi:uncharacterized protein